MKALYERGRKYFYATIRKHSSKAFSTDYMLRIILSIYTGQNFKNLEALLKRFDWCKIGDFVYLNLPSSRASVSRVLLPTILVQML